MSARDPLDAWPAFAEAVRARLEAGRTAYGALSFSRHPAELIQELQQEALDLAGWGFVLWARIERMRQELESKPTDRGTETAAMRGARWQLVCADRETER